MNCYARADRTEWGHPLGVPFVELNGDALLWSETVHWVYKFWSPLGEASVQAEVIHHLHPAQSHLVGATKQSMVGSCPFRAQKHVGDATL